MVSTPVIQAYRRDVKSDGQLLSKEEREKLLEPYLPPVQEAQSSAKTTSKPGEVKTGGKRRRRPIRSFLISKLHALAYFVVHLIFGIYMRLRQTYHAVSDRVYALLYYHHRTPELIQRDVKNLSRLPDHLSVILTLKGDEEGGREALADDVAELSAWCASAGIPLLSIYEKNGVLKPNMHSLHSIISRRLSLYFGSTPHTPHLRLHAPSYPSYPPYPPTNICIPPPTQKKTINILLLSSTDGRDTLVDLTRTLAEMSQSHKLHPQDITQELLNAELSATTSVPLPSSPTISTGTDTSTGNALTPETSTPSPTTPSNDPDLLIIFGPHARLDGYPPWQIRLTEIFCVGDSGGGARVEYQRFLRGLWKFAGAEMRFGS